MPRTQKPQPANATLDYLEWRDTVAARGEILFNALEKLTVPELYAAKDRLMGGLAAERLNPTHYPRGNFRLAAGIIHGLLHKAETSERGLNHEDLG